MIEVKIPRCSASMYHWVSGPCSDVVEVTTEVSDRTGEIYFRAPLFPSIDIWVLPQAVLHLSCTYCTFFDPRPSILPPSQHSTELSTMFGVGGLAWFCT